MLVPCSWSATAQEQPSYLRKEVKENTDLTTKDIDPKKPYTIERKIAL